MDSSEVGRVKRLLDSKRQLYDLNSHPCSAEEKQELMEKVYGEWMTSDGYEKDMVTLGYVAHVSLANLICSYVTDRASRLLDGACGTGLLGEELKRRGYQRIDALDACKEALDSCRKKGVHDKYWCEVLGSNRLPIQDDTYDGVCLSAAFGTGHVSFDCFQELIRITKPGGYIIFDIRESLFTDGHAFGGVKVDPFLHHSASHGRLDYMVKKRCLYMKSDEHVEYMFAFLVRVL